MRGTVLAAILGASAIPCSANAQSDTPVMSLSKALELAASNSPKIVAAEAEVRAATAARHTAGLRPNPSVNAEIENVGGSRAYNEIEAPKQTLTLSWPVELGGKRTGRVALADAQQDLAQIERAATGAEVRLVVTQSYVEAVAADRRLVIARDQASIAAEVLHAAHIRVVSGRASPLEEQRAEALRISADADVARTGRLAELARAKLARLIGQPVSGPLDQGWFDRIGTYGPSLGSGSNLAVAAAQNDEKVAEAQLRLARSQRVPDVTVNAGLRRVPISNGTAAVLGVSVPLPLFNSGASAVAQAAAERDRATALRRAAELENAQAVEQAQADLANATAAARTASGPSLSAVQEAARIARIGYREGKFGQLDLLEAERSLAETRASAVDALAAFHIAQAQLERLTTSVQD